MTRKQISFEVSEEEHEKIKVLAAQRRQSVKRMFFSALEKLVPGWNLDKKENSPEKR